MSEQEYMREADVARHYGVTKERVSQWREAGYFAPAIVVPSGERPLRLYRASDLPTERPHSPNPTGRPRKHRDGPTAALTGMIQLVEAEAPHLSEHPSVCMARRVLAVFVERTLKSSESQKASRRAHHAEKEATQ